MFWHLETSQLSVLYSEHSNGRCLRDMGNPAKVLFEGHLIVLLTSVSDFPDRVLVIRKVCVVVVMFPCSLPHAFASAIISAWTSRCLFKYKRRCEGLKVWNGNGRFPRFFVCWTTRGYGRYKTNNGNNNFDSDSKFVQQWANHPRGNGWHEGTITHAALPCTIGYALRTHVSRGVTTLKLSAVKHKMSTILINTYYVYTTHRLSALWRLHGIYAPHAVSGTKNLHHLQVPPLWAVLVFGGGALLMPQSSVCIPLVRRAVAMPL